MELIQPYALTRTHQEPLFVHWTISAGLFHQKIKIAMNYFMYY